MDLEASGSDNVTIFDGIMVLQPKGQFNHQGTNITISKAEAVIDDIKKQKPPYLLLDDARLFQLGTSEAFQLFAEYLNELHNIGFKDCIYLTGEDCNYARFIKRQLESSIDLKINLYFYNSVSEAINKAKILGYKTENLEKYFETTAII